MLFGMFSILAAGGVVLCKNPVYSAFSLILSLFGLAALYLLWGATFIAVIQVLIYSGAIVVLFVFVVMLLNLSKDTEDTPSLFSMAVIGSVVWLFSLFILRILSRAIPNGDTPLLESNLRSISKLLFTRYLWPFEILSLFLLVMIVAIFALTRSDEFQPGEGA